MSAAAPAAPKKKKRRGSKKKRSSKKRNVPVTASARKGACAAGTQAHRRGKRRAIKECGASEKAMSDFGRLGGKASARSRNPSESQRLESLANSPERQRHLASRLANP